MKQKHWKVSVFDKTSETIRDDTFYTTDTEAYLVFELIDEDFTPDSAMVAVYNIYGKATINASVEVVDGVVSYEIPEEAIGHPGGWRTQVIFTKDNEDYTTKIIEFDVGGHLLDNKKPAIVDIENWNSFIAHAGELIDDWEQLEEIRQTNEQQRELAESARQTNELARETAESVRVANEEERISKDSERDSKIEAVEGEVLQARVDKSGNTRLTLKGAMDANYNSLDSAKANKQQEVAINLTLVNGWEGFAKVIKDQFGVVHFQLSLSKGVSGTVAVLPIGYRPASNLSFVKSSNFGSAFNPTTSYNFIVNSSSGSISVYGTGSYVFANESFYSNF